MQGHFEVGAFHTPGLTEDELNAALGPKHLRKPDSVLEFLSQFHREQEVKGKNLMMDNCAALAFRGLFSGAAITNPFNYDPVGKTLGLIALTTHSSEPSYQESYGDAFVFPDQINGNVGSGTAKRFYADEVEPYLISEGSNGKESLTYRGRWLWLPAQAVSSTIRSICAWYRNGSSLNQESTDIVTRIRLKDSGGSPIEINKTASITLFVEYRVTVVSV